MLLLRNCVFIGKTPTIPFWDLVVLSAADEDQRTAFQMQLNEKIERGSLPLGVEYLTFADPGKAKIGKNNGLVDCTSLIKVLIFCVTCRSRKDTSRDRFVPHCCCLL